MCHGQFMHSAAKNKPVLGEKCNNYQRPGWQSTFKQIMLVHNSSPASVTTSMATGVYKLQNNPKLLALMFQEPWRKHNARINHATSSSLPIPYNPGFWLSYVWFLSSDFNFNTFVFYRSSNWNVSNSIFQIPWESNALKALSSYFQSLFCWEVLNREYENEIGVN